MHLDMLAALATNRSCTMRSRRNKNSAGALREMLQSRRGGFSVLRFTEGERNTHGRRMHVGGITFGLSQCRRFSSSDPTLLRCVYAHPVTPGAARRPSCIIQIALSLSVCAVITSADVFVTEHLASPRPVHGWSNGLIALSTQLRNCLQFTISPTGFSRARFSPINFTNAYTRRPFSSCLSRCINQFAQ